MPVRLRVAAALVSALSMSAMAADCAALLQQHLRTDLALPFEAFDQDDAAGWRPLGTADCDAESAQLIEAYIAARQKPHPVLRWHAAQAFAKAGEYPRAIELARRTRRPEASEATSEFQWNAYVDATIAFLQGDRGELAVNRNRLAEATAKSTLNRPNLVSAERLQRCFGQPYKQAYACRAEP